MSVTIAVVEISEHLDLYRTLDSTKIPNLHDSRALILTALKMENAVQEEAPTMGLPPPSNTPS